MNISQSQLRSEKFYNNNIQTETDSKCRLCEHFNETVDHIISTCPIISQEHYIKRHDRVCAQLHLNMFNEIGVKLDNEHWYDHVPKSIQTIREGKVTIVWNHQVRTDRIIPNNKPNIIIRNNKQGTCMLINVAISGDGKIITKEAGEILNIKTS